MVEGVKLESKLTSGFPALTGTVQAHKRRQSKGPNGPIKWLLERPLHIYVVADDLGRLVDVIQCQILRSSGYVLAITRRNSTGRPYAWGS